MSIDTNLLIALSIIRDECGRHSRCRECPLQDKCIINPNGLIPRCWTIPEPPPEPTERQCIEWLRMLPDDEMLDAVNHIGPHSMFPWHEVVNLEKFRKDVGLNERV